MNSSSITSQQPSSAEFYPTNISYIVETHPPRHDICLGRGNAVAQTSGNQNYRSIIKEFKTRYFEAKGHKAKNEVAKDVIKILQNNQGRTFYYKKKDHELWEKAPKIMILTKVKQALREKGGTTIFNQALHKKGKCLRQNVPALMDQEEVKRLKSVADKQMKENSGHESENYEQRKEISDLKSENFHLKQKIAQMEQQLCSSSNMPHPVLYTTLDQPQQRQFHNTVYPYYEAQTNKLEPMDRYQNAQMVIPIKANSNDINLFSTSLLCSDTNPREGYHKTSAIISDNESVLSSSSSVDTTININPILIESVTNTQENFDVFNEEDIKILAQL